MRHQIFLFFVLEMRKILAGTAFLKELCMHLTHLHFPGWCHLLKAVLVGSVGVSVSRVIYALSLEDNTSSYVDLTIFTFSENIVQETDVEQNGLRLIITCKSN